MTHDGSSSETTTRPHEILDLTVHPQAIDPVALRENASDIEAPLLLMSLVQMTGDISLLDRYGDHVTFSASADHRLLPEGRLPDADKEELLAILEKVGQNPGEQHYLQVPDDELFARMLGVVVGEEIPEEFFAIVKEQGGFELTRPGAPHTKRPPSDFKIAVLGAGMSGIAAAIAAADAGFDYHVYETADDIGGTWRINTYPGVAVDTPSIYYSFSYEIEAAWSKYYPLGPEYQNYLRRVVDKYDIKNNISFNTRIEAMQWDDEAQQWVLELDSNGERSQVRYNAVVTAAGFLNRPKFPDIPGRETFRGQSVHSAKWHDGVELAGKKVAVIGAGATSVQIVDAIIGDVAMLTLFQRQPHWVNPNHLGEGIVPSGERWAQCNIPFYDRWRRAKTYWFVSDKGYANVRVDPDWHREHPLSISAANDRALQLGLRHLEESFGHDPELKAKMTPDYPPYGKRPIRDPGGYFRALASEKGEVIATPLVEVVPEGLKTSDAVVHEFDVIIYATGFTLDFLSPIEIVGRDGRTLNEVWHNGTDPRSYLSGTVAGFPNLFITSSPNSSNAHGGGHNFMTEVAVHFIIECLQLVIESGAHSIEVTANAQEEFVAEVDQQMEGSIWRNSFGAHTYYRNAAGRVMLPNPWRMVDLWRRLRAPEPSSFMIR
ncbi:NAD(P)/FAD-dependent oxidoreductase [Micromonospora sp. NPDC005206]|uniref:flavin-containing monooxygenase n=1 Tax=Micromonospora sp. NPDC005206 TaxID=3157022 RepID=UPI0033ADDA1D